MNFKSILVIVFFYSFALFIFLAPHSLFSKKECFTHKSNESIKYLVKSSGVYSIQGDFLVKIPANKDYIKSEYLNSFFNKEECSIDIEKSTVLENGSFAENLRVWQMNIDLAN